MDESSAQNELNEYGVNDNSQPRPFVESMKLIVAQEPRVFLALENPSTI